jgi:transaldolase / glucose-6-phosphate isomerase
VTIALASLDRPWREALARLRTEKAVERIWKEDPSFWKSEESHRRIISQSLGWLTVADRMAETVPDLKAFASALRPETERVVVLGMGGSSLAPLVFSESFPARKGFPRLEILDSTDPAMIAATVERGDPHRTIFVVSSKSGTTLEPNIFFDFFFGEATRTLKNRAGERFVVVTDPGSQLEKEAAARGVRRIFPGDPRIGGRYSALSHFGIVPAALSGIDVAEILRRAKAMAAECRRDAPENPGLLLGAAMATAALAGRDKLTFSVGSPVDRFGMWIEQLIAESTGKEGKGILPVEGEALGPAGVYGSDRFFVAMGAGLEGVSRRLEALAAAGHPTAAGDISDALDLGGEMFRWEFATAVAGQLLGINPFDQPNVQEAKDRTNEILSGKAAPAEEPTGVTEQALSELLAAVKPRDYFAITAYIPSTSENEDKLNRVRIQVRDAKRVATTVGFGPRFLHSTGQLHKGGPDTGVFLQITTAEPADVSIPGKPYSFGQVIAAQAAGDLAALRSRGRRALRVHLEDVSAGLDRLSAAVAAAVA